MKKLFRLNQILWEALPTPPEMAYILAGVSILVCIAILNKVAFEAKPVWLMTILCIQSGLSLLTVIIPLYNDYRPTLKLVGHRLKPPIVSLVYGVCFTLITLSIHLLVADQKAKIDILMYTNIGNVLILFVIGARHGMKPPNM